MRKFYIFALVATMFAACATDGVNESSAVIEDLAPETLTVSFEGEESRIQLQEGKTVWNEGDLVSVFYRSNANQKWQFQGATGDRTGNLKRVEMGTATETMNRVVVVYPYAESYYINPETCNVEASLPATQTYIADSYGVGGNIMVSYGEYNQVVLKSVCGWLKLELTGNGESIKAITLKGNNGEQVAGQLYINSADATATLASEMGGAEDNGSAGGNLVFEDTILTEVTLNCGEGVTLSSEATAFYIALPPQTFTKGLTVEITATNGLVMTKSTDNEVVIERNHIKPMKAFAADLPIPETWKIYYTATAKVEPYDKTVFGATYVSNEWDSETGEGVITFDGDVTKIGVNAFNGYLSNSIRDTLTSVTIPDSVTSIGEKAFYNCTSLTSITIPDSVTEIGAYAFCKCTSLTRVDITDLSAWCKISFGNYDANPLYYGAKLYLNGSELTGITIPSDITEIKQFAFYGCTSLTSVTIPDSVTEIGDLAFAYSALTSVDVPNSVTSIKQSAFEGCTSLTSVTIPDSVVSIEKWGFANCTSMTNVAFPDVDIFIGDGAFSGCSSLTDVTIPDAVTTIGLAPFVDCQAMKAFYGKFASQDNRCLIVNDVLNSFAIGCGLTEYTIPDSVTSIGDSAFYGCKSLTGVKIPDSVTSIGECAFQNCTSLTSITIPESVAFIGWNAFMYCDSLKYVYCNAVTPPAASDPYGIGWGAFLHEVNGYLRPIDCKIYVPVLSVDAYKVADGWKDYADSIVADPMIICYTSSDDNVVTPYRADAFGANIVSNTYENGQGLIVFDAPVTSIGSSTFYSCTSLTSITIPDSVTSIEYDAFYNCSSLKRVDICDLSAWCKISFGDYEANPLRYGAKLYLNGSELTDITIPSDIAEIKNFTFYGCTSLTSVTIPDSVTSIGKYAFCDCTSLTSITIPDSVTEIGYKAFDGCSSQKKVYYGGDLSAWCKIEFENYQANPCVDGKSHLYINGTEVIEITIPSDISQIKNNTFCGCKSLTSVIIPDSVTGIGWDAFAMCTSLANITIPDGITVIEHSTFFGCTSLTNITIPDSVTSIKYGAFRGCTSLQEVNCKATTPPTGGSEMFDKNASGRKIYVPIGSGEAYKAKEYWSDYADYIEEKEF